MEDKPAGSSSLPTSTSSDTPPTTIPGMASDPVAPPAPTTAPDPFASTPTPPPATPSPAPVVEPTAVAEPTPIVVTTPPNISSSEPAAPPTSGTEATSTSVGTPAPAATPNGSPTVTSGAAPADVITASAHRGSSHKIWIAVSVIVVVIISGLLGAFLFMKPSGEQAAVTESTPAPVADVATPPPAQESIDGPAMAPVKKEVTVDEMVASLDQELTTIDGALTKADQGLADKQGDLKE